MRTGCNNHLHRDLIFHIHFSTGASTRPVGLPMLYFLPLSSAPFLKKVTGLQSAVWRQILVAMLLALPSELFRQYVQASFVWCAQRIGQERTFDNVLPLDCR